MKRGLHQNQFAEHTKTRQFTRVRKDRVEDLLQPLDAMDQAREVTAEIMELLSEVTS